MFHFHDLADLGLGPDFLTKSILAHYAGHEFHKCASLKVTCCSIYTVRKAKVVIYYTFSSFPQLGNILYEGSYMHFSKAICTSKQILIT